MGSHVPVISGRKVAQTFQRFGWTVDRQQASHIIMTKAGEVVSLSVPDHKEVARGTPRNLIRAANVTVDQFLAAL